jgi:hypothetical protein
VKAVDATFDIIGDYDSGMESTIWLSREFEYYIGSSK